LLEAALEERGKAQDRAARAARLAKWIVIPASAVVMIGIVGGGYCDNVAGRFARVPVPSLGLTYPANYRGSTRYVTRLDARICDASFPVGFSAAAIGFMTSFLYYARFGKLLPISAII
jgi:hypothetical protein